MYLSQGLSTKYTDFKNVERLLVPKLATVLLSSYMLYALSAMQTRNEHKHCCFGTRKKNNNETVRCLKKRIDSTLSLAVGAS